MAEIPTSENSAKADGDVPTEENNVITMLDVLQEEQDLEDDAQAVLGASDHHNCTYSEGYVKRQALYACVTCIPFTRDGIFKPGGMCLACSYSCHEGHELVELYTKRNFRCDCGNSKFQNGPENRKCNLEPNKTAENEKNLYNHNFYGLYCTCNRPYPDPEDTIDDEMIQCIICEDWYHSRHLGSTVPSSHDYSEMVCGTCMNEYPFLQSYKGLTATKVEPVLNGESTTSIVDVIDPVKLDSEVITDGSLKQDVAIAVKNEVAVQNNENEVKVNIKELKPKDCKLVHSGDISTTSGAVFFIGGWRKQLCTCESCMTMYSVKSLTFLTDEQDTVQAYEEKGKYTEDGNSQYEQGMRALSSLDRTQQVEALLEYNNMKTELKEYLQKFVENKKVVREEDIREFFSMMEARKRRRTDEDYQPQYFCR